MAEWHVAESSVTRLSGGSEPQLPVRHVIKKINN